MPKIRHRLRAWRQPPFAARNVTEACEGVVYRTGVERKSVEHVTEIIQFAVDGRQSVKALLAFPAPEFFIGPAASGQALGHIKSVALLRLADQTVWMLVVPGEAWTRERLQAAAAKLAIVSRRAFTIGAVQRLLRKDPGIASAAVVFPRFDIFDENLWEIDKVAYALVRQRDAGRPYSEFCRTGPQESVWTVRAVLRDGLEEALRDFVDSMDPHAFKVANASGRLDLRTYNYLVHREYRQYRLQFAETFPSLLQTAVVARSAGFGEDLRSIVDTGAPLIKGLAARWGVRPGVIRHLVGQLSGNVGIQWSRDARGLALALNALHPQDLPADSPNEWSKFNRMVITGQRLFLQPIWKSAAGLDWLRECVRLSRRGDRQALNLWLPQWNDIEPIIRFRTALAGSLREETDDAPASAVNDADAGIDDVIDRFVLQLAGRELLEVASVYAEELRRTQKYDGIGQVLSRLVLMSLLPADFISSDGRTRVTALTTDRQLRMHGSKMRNCLRGASACSISGRGKVGTVFIVGLFDATSHKALSTAEIRAFPSEDWQTCHLIVKQHTGAVNGKPGPRCIGALQELLRHCQGDEVREHLMSNWKSLRRRGRGESGQLLDPPAALRRTLGEQCYAELISRVRNAKRPVHAAAAAARRPGRANACSTSQAPSSASALQRSSARRWEDRA